MPKPFKWKCPQCGAPSNAHGKGACADFIVAGRDGCEGLVCECWWNENEKHHGETHDNPCRNAHCYHCEWYGTLPVPNFDPKKLKGWAKQAYAAGWKPPPGWTP